MQMDADSKKMYVIGLAQRLLTNELHNDLFRTRLTIRVCASCNVVECEAHYELNGWCDKCGAFHGYLPDNHQAYETRLVFKPIHLWAKTFNDWEFLKKTSRWWGAFGEQIIKTGKLIYVKHKTLKEIIDEWDEGSARFCADCGAICGNYQAKNYCSSRCYMRNYRKTKNESKNKGTTTERRVEDSNASSKSVSESDNRVGLIDNKTGRTLPHIEW